MTTATKSTKSKSTKAESNGRGVDHATTTPSTSPRRSVRDDGAREVAKASNGKLNMDQVRILRYLKTCRKPVDRASIKEGVGIGRDGMYSSSWLNNLWQLQIRRPKFILIEEHEPEGLGHAKHSHMITPEGKAALEEAEKAAKVAGKTAAKPSSKTDKETAAKG